MSNHREITCPSCGKATPQPEDLFARTTTCTSCGRTIALEELVTMAPAASAPTASGESLAGHRLGSCRLVRLIGRGGMGEVYEAVQESLNRRVAVKVLPPHLAANESFVQRFNRESGALAKLSHPNIVAIHDCGREGEHYFFVLDFVTGPDGQAAPTLHQRLHSGLPLPVVETARLIQEIAEALDYAHRKGVIHRDVKPSNVLIAEDDHARLVDFGIAHLADGAAGEALRLTMTGDVLGTAGYLAPEQRQGHGAVDARADVYSCGAVLYEMLTGRIPEGLFELPSELVSDLDPRWNAIIEKALQRNPDRRFQTMGDFLKTLHALSTAAPLAPTTPAPTPAAPAPTPASTITPQPATVRESHPRTEAAFTPIVGKCVQCQTINPGDNRFCTECGASLYEPCLGCQVENRVGTKYCGQCGADMGKLKRVARYRREIAGQLQQAGQRPGVAALPALDEARETLAKLLVEQPDDADTRKTLAEVLERTRPLLLERAQGQRGSEAMVTFRHALGLFPGDGEAQAGLDTLQRQLQALLETASQLVSKGEFSSALEHLGRSLEEFGPEAGLLKARDEANARWRAQFLEKARGQRKGEAMATYREMLERFPGDNEAQSCLSGIARELASLADACTALLAKKKFQHALDHIQAGQEQFGEEPRLIELRAQAWARLAGALREELSGLAVEHKFITLLRRLEEVPEWARPLEGEAELREQAARAIQQAEEYISRAVQLLAANKLREAAEERHKAWSACEEHTLANEGAQRVWKAANAADQRLGLSVVAVAMFTSLLVLVGSFVWNWAAPKLRERKDRNDWAQVQASVKATGQDDARIEQLYQDYQRAHPGGCGTFAASQAVEELQDKKAWARTEEAVKAAGQDQARIKDIYAEYEYAHPHGRGVLTAAQACKQILADQADRNAWEQLQVGLKTSNDDEARVEQLYRQYLSEQPNGRNVSNAAQVLVQLEEKQRERSMWARTQEGVKAAAENEAEVEKLYRQYLSDHPNGSNAPAAKQALAQLEESARSDRKDWDEAQQGVAAAGNGESRAEQLYKEYLSKHPKGQGASHANLALAQIEEARQDRNAWALTQEAVRTAGEDEARAARVYQQYLEDHPKGKGAATAKDALTQIEERVKADQLDWSETQRGVEAAGTIEVRIERLYKQYLDKHPKGQGASVANRFLDQLAKAKQERQQAEQERIRLAQEEEKRPALIQMKLGISMPYQAIPVSEAERIAATIATLIKKYAGVKEATKVEVKTYTDRDFIEEMHADYAVSVDKKADVEELRKFLLNKSLGRGITIQVVQISP